MTDEQTANVNNENNDGQQEEGITLEEALNSIPAANGKQAELAADYLDALQRERAAFINYKRRVEAERNDLIKLGKADVIMKILVVLDDLELALKNAPDLEQFGERERRWLNGVLGIERKMRAILEKEGVSRIEAKGQPFDPQRHEAIAYDEEGEGEPDTVSEEYRPGYTYGDKVLRHSVVKVKKG